MIKNEWFWINHNWASHLPYGIHSARLRSHPSPAGLAWICLLTDLKSKVFLQPCCQKSYLAIASTLILLRITVLRTVGFYMVNTNLYFSPMNHRIFSFNPNPNPHRKHNFKTASTLDDLPQNTNHFSFQPASFSASLLGGHIQQYILPLLLSQLLEEL